MKSDFIQTQNPITKRYVKINKTKGIITGHKKSKGPYKGIRILRRPEVSPWGGR